MRLSTTTTILFFLLAGNSVSAQDKAKPDNPQRDTPAPQQPPSTVVEVNVGYPKEAEYRQPTKQEAKKESVPMTRFEWIISIITFIYSAFSVFTFFAIKRQVRAAEGELAAQSPWIMVNVEYSPGMTGPFLGTSSGKDIEGVQRHTDFMFRFDCVNHGRTPALITEKAAILIMVPKGKLPNKPDLSSLKIIDSRVEPLAAGERSKQGKDEYLSVPGYQGLDDWVVLYGVVRYRDVFGRNRQTTFGYEVTLGHKIERLSGYPKYNEND